MSPKEREIEVRLEVVRLLRPNPASTEKNRDDLIKTAHTLSEFILKGSQE